MEATGHRALVLALVLLAATAAAGCVGSTDEEAAPTSDASDAAGTGNETAPSRSSDISIEGSHDYTGPEKTIPFDVPANATVARIALWFTPQPGEDGPGPAAGACYANEELAITLTAPNAEDSEEVTFAGQAITVGSGGGCGGNVQRTFDPPVPIAEGTWEIAFTGSGVATGHIVLD